MTKLKLLDSLKSIYQYIIVLTSWLWVQIFIFMACGHKDSSLSFGGPKPPTLQTALCAASPLLNIIERFCQQISLKILSIRQFEARKMFYISKWGRISPGIQ